MSKLIFDVTQLFYWKGKLTGIPRVMNEYAQRFARHQDAAFECVFVVWDGAKQGFYSVNVDGIGASHAAATTSNSAASQSLISKRDTIIRKVKSAEQNSLVARKALGLARRSLHTYRNLQAAKVGELKKVVPVKGDVIFVPWGEWSDERLIKALKQYKEQGAALVQFAHDMIPVLAPQFSGHSTTGLKHYAGTLYPLCDAIIANSEYTKGDVASWLKQQGLSVPPIKVIRLGDDFALAQPTKPSGRQFNGAGIEPSNYLLCVGTMEVRKNHALLYYVYKLALERNVALPKLVIVGRLGWQAENTYELITKDPLVNKQMIVLSNISDSELSWLYENCLFSIYPSFYEGWGLPIAESIAHGKTCLSSNTSSMPEIAGDLVNYFSPFSTDQCLEATISLLDPTSLRRAEEKLRRYKSVSWDESFEQVKTIIGELNA